MQVNLRNFTLFNEKNKEKTLSYFNNHKINDDVMVEVLYEEEETYSLNLRFSSPLFCGFSCSNAITYLFTDDILRKIERIFEDNENNIKDVSLIIECYENKIAKRYYMDIDIVGKASNILHIVKPNIYFTVGKDGIYTISELNKCCKRNFGMDIFRYNNLDEVLKNLKLLKREYMINKNENYKKIVLVTYCIIFVKKLIKKNIEL